MNNIKDIQFKEMLMEDIGLYDMIEQCVEAKCQWIENGIVCDRDLGWYIETKIPICPEHILGKLYNVTMEENF